MDTQQATETLTPFQKAVKAVKILFATKKAVMAVYALVFGATVAGVNYASSGLTAEEVQTITMMKQQIMLLETKVDDLAASRVVEHTHEETQKAFDALDEELDGLVVAIGILNDTKVDENHSHPQLEEKIAEIKKYVDDQVAIVDLKIKEILNSRIKNEEPKFQPEPIVEESKVEPDVKKSEKIPAEEKRSEYNKNGILLDGVWIEL